MTKNRSLLRRGIRRYRESGLKETVAATINYLSRQSLEVNYSLEYQRALLSLYDSNQVPSPTLSVLDIGARNGPLTKLEPLIERGKLHFTGLEPDESECSRLRQKYPEFEFYPVALSDTNSTKNLYIMNNPAWSSFYRLNQDLLSLYGGYENNGEVDHVQEVETKTLDKFVDSVDGEFDYIKLDTQGSEFDILSEGRSVLSDTLGVEFETHFKPLYNGQGLFADIDPLLRKLGFQFVDFHEHTHTDAYQSVGPNNPDGILLEADAYYTRLQADDRYELIKLIIISLILEKKTLALQIMRANDSILSKKETRFLQEIINEIPPEY